VSRLHQESVHTRDSTTTISMDQHLDSGYHSGLHQTGLLTDGKARSNQPVRLQIQTTDMNENPPKEPETETPLCQIESTSSVCHSPTWAAVSDKKRRKRAEKENLAKEKRLDKEKEVLDKRLRKVEEKRGLGDQRCIRHSLDINPDVKSKRPSFTLRRLSIASAAPEVQSEERKSRRLSKSRPIDESSSISSDRLQPNLNQRPNLLSRKNGLWSQSFPNFPFRTLPRLNSSRSGKELVDKGQMALQKDSERIGGERGTVTRDSYNYASNDCPEGGSACPKEATTPSRAGSNDKATSSQVPDPRSELPLVPHSKHQRKLARKVAITTQSPRQLYSQDGSRDQKTHVYASTSLQTDTLKVAVDHSRGQPTQPTTISSPLSNSLPSTSFPLRQHPPSGQYQDFSRGIESLLREPNNIEPENVLEKIPDSTIFRRERSDKRDARILEWNEQVTSQDQEAVVQDSMNLHHRRMARHQLKQKDDNRKQIEALQGKNPMKGEEFVQSPEQTPAKQENTLLIHVEQRLKSEPAGVVAEKISDRKSSDKKYKDREVLRPIRPNPPTRPWTWNLPFSSLWQAKANAISSDSNTSSSSSSPEASVEQPDTVLISSSQGQRSRCSSTTIKPTISGQPKPELLVEPAVPILKVPHGNCSQTDTGPCEQCNLKRTEDKRQSTSSQLVDATLLDLKPHNLGAGLRPGERERRSSLGPDTGEPGLALTPGPTPTSNELPSMESPDWIQVSHKPPKKSTASIQANAAKFTPLAVPRAYLPHSKHQSTFKESQEKVSISDGSESISHLSTKSTSLSSSFDKCSLPPEASANSYGGHPASVSRRSLNRSASCKPGQVAKIFIVCCRCCRWHDPPSDFFQEFITRVGRAATITLPAQPSEDPGESTIGNQSHVKNAGKEKSNFACHWCEHEMSRQCCASWTSLCSFHQRHWTPPDSQR
jgi:hypothetical protein